MPRFTEPVVKALIDRTRVPKGKRDVIIADDAMPGFFLRIFASETACYGCRYRVGRQSRRMTLGPVVEGGLKDARKLAQQAISRSKLGQDVQAEKKARAGKVVTPLSDVVDAYLKAREWQPRKTDAENVNDGRLRPRTWKEAKRYLEGDYWKPLRPRAIDEIGRADVVKQVVAIADGRGKVTADRARAHLTMLFAWAMDRHGLLANPCLGIKAQSGNARRERTLSDDEIREVWHACANNNHDRIVKLLLLTGMRKEEVGGLALAEINADEKRLELPPERTKNHLPYVLPLSDEALAVIAETPVWDGYEFLFGGTEVNGFSGWGAAKRRLDARIAKAREKAGIKEEMPRWTLHDLRRTVSTGMSGLKVAPAVVEAVLNHISGVKNAVAGIYNKYEYLDEKREALEAWGKYVSKLTG